MGNKLSNYFDQIVFLLVLAIAGVTPLVFTNLTTDFFDTPKLIFLVGATILVVGLWSFSWVLKGKISINRTPLDLPWIGLLVIVLASAFLSVSRYPAIFGNMTRMHGTLISWVTYIVLFFVIVSNLNTKDRLRSLWYVLLGSGLIVAIVSIFSFFKLYLPLDFAKSVNFTPAGSTFSALAVMFLVWPLTLISIVKPNKFLPLPVALASAAVMGIAMALIGSLPIFVLMAITVGLCLKTVGEKQVLSKSAMLLVPIGLSLFIVVLGYFRFPGNIFQQTSSSFPREIQLPLGISWKVTASAFRDAPFIGTGPATYGLNFTAYKPNEFNLLNYWNVSFDTAYNELLQVLGTLGFFGLAAWIIIGVTVFRIAWKYLNTEGIEGWMAVSSIGAIMLLFVHATTLVSMVTTMVIWAALLMAQDSIRERIAHISLGLKASMADNKQFDLFPLFVFIIFLVACIPLTFKYFNTVLADGYHRKALSVASSSGTQTYQYLQKAEALNPYVDLYRVDLAQTNFALANAIAGQATGSAGLNDQQKQTIQTLLSQAITEGRVAVTLNPRSSANWEVLGSIYRNITGVAQNSLTFALDAYGKAIQRDPMNPVLRVTVGGIYYSAKNYDMTVRFFSDAVNLKPDYVNGYYNLAIALRDKGDLANAKLIADQAVNILQKDPTTPDYKAAKALVEDLKSKIAAVNPVKPPAAETNSALQNPKLPDVNVPSLSNPPESSTPAAVRRNPDAVLPPNPTPTP